MVNYNKSIVYKLCCKDPSITDEYVGSTVNFTRRKTCHKSSCTRENSKNHNLRVYQKIRECGGWENWTMVEVERYCATDRKDLHSRERFWLEELGCTLNSSVPNRGRKESCVEYYQNNKEKITKSEAEYRKNNKEKINKRATEYRKNNKEKINKTNAEYRKRNKEKINKSGAEYYQNNKEKINKKKTEYRKNNEKKIECQCGCFITGNLTRHLKTAKHKKLMELK